MKLQPKLVITAAKPILGQQLQPNSFLFYVQYWLVSGYHWDGVKLCSAKKFKDLQINVHSLDVSKKLIQQKMEELPESK